MRSLTELENTGDQRKENLKIQCVDYATRVVGKPEYLNIDGKWEKQQEDVVKIAEQIYKFVTGF